MKPEIQYLGTSKQELYISISSLRAFLDDLQGKYFSGQGGYLVGQSDTINQVEQWLDTAKDGE